MASDKKKGREALGDAAPISTAHPPVTPYRPLVPDRPMSPKELADFLRVSPTTIRRKMARGKLPYFRIGRQIRFLPGEVIQALRNADDE